MNPLLWLDTMLQDLRYGIRELARNRGFATTAIASLALGIMAATAMYSVLYGVVLEPFPYKDVDNLVSIAIRNPAQRGWRGSYSIDEYVELASRSSVFGGVAASTISNVLWRSGPEPVRLRGNHISHNGFDVMGVPALLGRIVTASDQDPETKAVLGYRFWIRQFGGNPSVLGSTLVLNGRHRTIVGVMPPRFMFRGADVYLPIHYRAGGTPEGVTTLQVTARRGPGLTAAQAEADLAPIIRELSKRFPERYPPQWKIELITFKETFPSDIREVLWIMFAAVGLLLLIACANVSSLLLARASVRQREMAMRAALGAGRTRLFRQLLTESLLLGFTGGAAGIVGSWLGLKAILTIVPPDVIPAEAEVVLNLPVLLFSFGLCILTTLLFGLVPVLHATGTRLSDPLKESGRSTGGSKRMGWMRSALVVAELSLAIILLCGAGLFLNTLLRLYHAPLAVDIHNRLVVQIPMSWQGNPSLERRTEFLRQVLERVGALPGVLGTGINSGLHPLGSTIFPVEVPSSTTSDTRPVNLHQVNAGYLKATGIDTRQGRWLEDSDIAAMRHVMVVNQFFVKRYFNGQTPLGKIVQLPRLKAPPYSLAGDRFEIVGVVEDALNELHNDEPQTEAYIPYSITGLADVLVVHTSSDPMRLAPLVRREIFQLDSSQVVDEMRTIEGLMERYIYSRGRFHVWLMGIFGAVGLLLAVVGVYGVIAQIVSVQRREFGVRMAVGAAGSDIVQLVMRRGIRLMAVGLSIGILITLLLLKRFSIELEVSDPFDPASISGACFVLFAAGAVACLIPALRAARTNPVQALRLE